MNPKAVIRSLEEKEIETYNFQYKMIEGTLVIVNGSVNKISLLLEHVETTGQREALRRDVFDLPLSDAKSVYLVLRSMLKITGDLKELDECIL